MNTDNRVAELEAENARLTVAAAQAAWRPGPGLWARPHAQADLRTLLAATPSEMYRCDWSGCEGHPCADNYCSAQRRYGARPHPHRPEGGMTDG